MIAFYERYAAKRLASPVVYPKEDGYRLDTLRIGDKERIVAHLEPRSGGVRLVDMLTGEVLLVRPNQEHRVVAQGRHPIRAIDFPRPNAEPAILLAELGIFRATDTHRGGLFMAGGNGANRPLIESIGRVADAVVEDFDGDGHDDIAVAVFGWQKTGGLFLLRGSKSGKFRTERLSMDAGYVALDVGDIDGDTQPEIIAQVAQHHERIEVWHLGRKTAKQEVIFNAPSPLWGSMGLSVVDLDRDGDLDIVHWNGDNLDAPKLAPFQGVHLLENRGSKFKNRQIVRMPGVHDVAIDHLDNNGYLDLVAVANLPPRIRETLVSDNTPTQSIELDGVIKVMQEKPGQFSITSLVRNQTCFSAVTLAHWYSSKEKSIILGGFGLGWTLLDHHGDAGSTAEQAPCNHDALFILSPSHLGPKKHKKVGKSKANRGLKALKRIVDNDPDDALNRVNLGNLHLAAKRFREAEYIYREALEADPNLTAAALNLALVLDVNGRANEAIHVLAKILAKKPDFADGHNQMGTILYRKRQFKSALLAVDQALKTAPSNPSYLANKGNILAALKRYAEAEAIYKRVLFMDPKHPTAKEYLQRVRTLRGDKP